MQWIEWPLPPLSTLNDGNRAVTQADEVQDPENDYGPDPDLPDGLDGAGVTALVLDGGTALESHVDFEERVSRGNSSNLDWHATHVCGTIGGAGIKDSRYKGMAPGVRIESYGITFSGEDVLFYLDAGNFESVHDEAINRYGAAISNNSIGLNLASKVKFNIPGYTCDLFGDYGMTAELIDAIVAGRLGSPFRIVLSAGNERNDDGCPWFGFGYGSIAPPAGAKNAITVGAVHSDGREMTNFSSWGPLDDGRLKPDIVTPGCQITVDGGVTSTSCGEALPGERPVCVPECDDCYYTACGTSMAAPTVTGLCALLLQKYRATFQGAGDPLNSTVKALLVHNAEDLGETGPDYKFGYGLVQIRDTIDFMVSDDGPKFLEGSACAHPYAFAFIRVHTWETDSPLKVTLAWDDAPGTPNSQGSDLVNDLDLIVVDPDWNQYYPWTLDPSDPTLAAVQTQEDHINNIEQVVVQNPVAGDWRVYVHVDYEDGQCAPQTFSLCGSPRLMRNCNGNDEPDSDEIQWDLSLDCYPYSIPGLGNGILDECEPDCDNDGMVDSCRIASCPYYEEGCKDCNEDGVPNECEPWRNCNVNGERDSCDIANGTSQDCNFNSVPDECDVDPTDPDGDGTFSADCQLNGVPDECELRLHDCNDNGVLDECDLDPTDPDGNGEISNDCQPNGVPDECDVDCNVNGIPDECEGTSRRRVFVKQTADPNVADGTTWATAFTTLRDALAIEKQCSLSGSFPSGADIWVAAGTYAPDEPDGDANTSFELVNNVSIYGGFAGVDETSLDQRDPQANETTLTGDLNGNDVPVECGAGLPECSESMRACVDGYCILENYIDENSDSVVYASYVNETALLDGFTITAAKAGAGIFINCATPTITNCRFVRNYNMGAALTYSSPSDPDPGDCPSTMTANFRDCTFFANLASQGAGASNTFGSPRFVACEFVENVALTSGGGMASLGGMPECVNCVFRANSAPAGGAVYSGAVLDDVDKASFINCTIYENVAQGTVGAPTWGGGVFVQDSEPKIVNSILWENEASSGTIESAQIFLSGDLSIADVTQSCIQDDNPDDTAIPFEGALFGNIDDNPEFRDSAADLRLCDNSPCIDGGTDSAVGPDITEDLAGNPRQVDVVVGGALVDMGAYEFQATECCNTSYCDNGVYCDGPEVCEAYTCLSSVSPCAPDHPVCVEEADECRCDGESCGEGYACVGNTCGSPTVALHHCSPECNGNGIADECDLDPADPDGDGKVSDDCNANGVPDECEPDCNGNGVADACDIAQGTSEDCNLDDRPDECGVVDQCLWNLMGYPAPLSSSAASDNSSNDGSPRITTDGQGNWVAVWDYLDDAAPAFYEVLVSTSNDDGATWSSVASLNEPGYGHHQVPYVTTDGQGNWLAVWESNDQLYDPPNVSLGTDWDILFSTSTDNGVNWSDPAPLNTNADSDFTEDEQPQLTTDGQGTWIAVWESYDDSTATIGIDKDILLSVSTDNGVSWSTPTPLNTNAEFDSGYDAYPQLATDGQGNWIAIWESDDDLGGTIGTDVDVLYSVSADNGANWSAPTPLNAGAESDSVTDAEPQLTTDKQGKWLAVWRSNNDLGGTIGGDGDILFSVSEDNGASWTTPAPLNAHATLDADHDYDPQLTTDGLGNWLAVWCSNHPLGGTIGTDKDILLSYSMDNGKTWAYPAPLNTNAGADSGDDYSPQLATDGQRRWVAVWTSEEDLGGTLGTDADILFSRFRWVGNDCNCDGIADTCEISDCTGDPACSDCNGNEVPDVCDITEETSWDCQPNGIPDECENDCNGNRIADECDLADCDGSPSCSDCNENDIPDECDLDCDSNEQVDECEIAANPDLDLDGNGFLDACAILYVNAEGPEGNGTEWDAPFLDLQDALDIAAQAPLLVREIRVAAGTYDAAPYQLVDNVWVYGGFDGSTEEPFNVGLDERDLVANETILTGNGLASVIVDMSGTGDNTRLNGFTITAAGPSSADGAGIKCVDCETRINNCTVKLNNVKYGGMHISGETSAPQITDCIFAGNVSSMSAGSVTVERDGTDELARFVNCAFVGNRTATGWGSGGGIYTKDGGDLEVTNCTFSNNVPKDVYSGGTSNTLVQNSVLWGDDDGGIVDDGSTSLAVTYSCVQGGWTNADCPTENPVCNIQSDPLFMREPSPGPDGDWDGVDDDYGALWLLDGSPAIDAADSMAVPAGVDTDLAGKTRFFDDLGTTDTGNPSPTEPVVDMGAYEFQILPPALPSKEEHRAKKNRYISMKPSVNEPYEVAYRVELAEMLRCAGLLAWSCNDTADCPLVCSNDQQTVCDDDSQCYGGLCNLSTAPCNDQAETDVVLGWVSTPFDPSCQYEPGDTPFGACEGNDYLARVVGEAVYRHWDEPTVHIGDCEVVPAAAYGLSATRDALVFSDQLAVGTIDKPAGEKHFGDVVGDGTGDLPPLPGWAPPNGIVNVTDIHAFILTADGPDTPSVHPTWVDMHGLGDAITVCSISDQPCYDVTDCPSGEACVPVPNGDPPNFILNVTDLQRILLGDQGYTYTQVPGQLNPVACSALNRGENPIGSGVTLTMTSNADIVFPPDPLEIDVYVSSNVDLGAYDITPDVTGGTSGQLELSEIRVDRQRADYAFRALGEPESDPVYDYDAELRGQGRAMNALISGDVYVQPDYAYLATYVYQPVGGATGVFNISIRTDDSLYLTDRNAVKLPVDVELQELVVGVGIDCFDDADCEHIECKTATCTNYECSYTNVPLGTSCDDGMFCTKTDECNADGNCLGSGDPCKLFNPTCCELGDYCTCSTCQCTAQ